MAKLVYVTNASLDGYIADATGDFAWENAEQVHPFVTELLRPIGTHLYGRRLYETMAFWDGPIDGYPPEHRAFARLWQQAEKIVFSRTLTAPATRNTRVERQFDVETVRRLKAESARDLFIGGAEVAGAAFDAGLVDECHLFVHPVVLGGGKPAFRPGVRRTFELVAVRRVGAGIVHLHYRPVTPAFDGMSARAE